MSLSLSTCGRRFRRAFPSNRRFFNEIVAYQELFCVVTLLSELERPRQRRRKRGHIKSNRFPIKVDSQGLPFVSIGVKSSTYLKNEDVFTQNVFLVHQQTILDCERNFRAISLLKFVSKRLVLKPVSSSQEEINMHKTVSFNQWARDLQIHLQGLLNGDNQTNKPNILRNMSKKDLSLCGFHGPAFFDLWIRLWWFKRFIRCLSK